MAVTKAQAVAAVRAAIKAAPETVNPFTRDQGRIRCLYHQGRGNNIKRCIAGQVAWNLGLPTPAATGYDVESLTEEGEVWAGLLTPGAAAYLRAVQQSADGDMYNQPRAWGDIPRDVVAGRKDPVR